MVQLVSSQQMDNELVAAGCSWILMLLEKQTKNAAR